MSVTALMTAPADQALLPLLEDARLVGAELAVMDDEEGTVLTGTVRNIWQYQALRTIFARLPVVIDVGIVAARRDDGEIADAVRDVLGPEGVDVRARVRRGLVTLSGTADAFAHAMVLTRVGTLPGVVGIMDNIRA